MQTSPRRRLDMTRLTRQVIVQPMGSRQIPPKDPDCTWLEPNLVLRTNPDVVPPYVDLEAPRVSRVFQWNEDLTINLIIFPADPSNRLIPPYPGPAPKELDDPNSPSTSFTDGTLGKWDPRFYPQLYDPCRPWLPFHVAPRLASVGCRNGRWGSLMCEARPEYHRTLEYLPVTEFFQWNVLGKLGRGGCWNRGKIESLFLRRLHAEDQALQCFEEAKKVDPFFPDHSSYNLPWYDGLSYEDTLSWLTWQEGRDALGRTCRYVAEITALADWMLAKVRHVNVEEPKRESNWENKMGTWASTISSMSQWRELYVGRVPIYIIGKIPSAHPMLKTSLMVENLDNGERLRQNPFDSAHRCYKDWQSIPCFHYKQSMSSCNLSALNKLPLETISPKSKFPADSPLSHVPAIASPKDIWYKTWINTISTDQNSLGQQYALQLDKMGIFKAECRAMLWFIPPQRGILTVETYCHPFFHLYPGSRNEGAIHFREVHDKAHNLWWFQQVNADKLPLAVELDYTFSYPQHNLTIYTSHPFPGLEPSFCRTKVDLTPLSDPPNLTRHYFWKRPSSYKSQDDAEYTWVMEDERSESALPSVSKDPGFSFESSETFDLGDMGHVAEEMDHCDEVEGENEETGQIQGAEAVGESNSRPRLQLVTEHVTNLLAQREACHKELKRRIFNPIKGSDLQSATPVSWQIPGLAPHFVWPIRITELHGDTSVQAVIKLLTVHCHVSLANILIFATYNEFDTTRTVDIGMRYSEDVMAVWALLHGVEVDGRCLIVYPLSAMRGRGVILTKTDRDSTNRLCNFLAIEQASIIWPENGNFNTAVAEHKSAIIEAQWEAGVKGDTNVMPMIPLWDLSDGKCSLL